MRTSRKGTVLLVTALFVIAGAAGVFASGTQQTAAAAEPVTMNYHISGEPGVYDPSANWVYELGVNQWVPLVGWDAVKNEIYPRGATSWTVSADGLTWTFNIRRNWLWSDGRPVTAGDFVYGFQTTVDPATASPTAFRLSIVKNAAAVTKGTMPVSQLGVTAVDDHTLRVTLETPASWFLVSLSTVGWAAPKWAREQHGADWTNPENIVVNGPYKLTSRIANDVYVLEKNPNYYDAANVQIEKINMIIVPSQATALAMYENGELDTVMVPPADLERVQRDPVLGKEFTSIARLITQMYWFNVGKPPFDNVLVRKAFAAAVDKETLVTRITRGGEKATNTTAPPGVLGYVDPSSMIGIPYDPAQAARYLAEAGYPGGRGLPPISLGFNFSEFNANVAQAIQAMWKTNLGVEVTLNGVEGGAYGTLVAAGEFSVSRAGWGMSYPDANYIHEGLYHSKTVSGTSRDYRWLSPAFDRLIDQAAVETSQARREELYLQAEKILVQDDVGLIPLFFQSDNRVTKPYLNRILVPLYTQEFWDWTITR